MRYFCTIFTLLLFLAAASAVVSQGAMMGLLRISDGRLIDVDRMLAESGSASYFFVGENHDNAWHHAAQLAIIRRLHQSGRPVAIGLEMFAVTSQDKLDQWVAGKLPLREFRKVYARNWTLPWHFYREILLYARDNRIPLIGLNLPSGISAKVARQGFAALTAEERRQLPAGVTCNVDPAYMAFIRQGYAIHAMQDKEFTHFCEAQLLWNRNMGRRLAEFQARHPRYTLVALVGIGHALKKGVPAETTSDGSRYRVILPEYAGLNRSNLTTLDADYLLPAEAL